ncbi:dihydrodipicolinate synthase family protein [Sinomonas terrae]|uniref:Dihydrodipicolinate synthase family protein n=1 Tax=Sinomonas terrae TaxID=2908838 RepID=A0ABS9U0A0_9MICC|nr:dihydrodipicolinate synthase family protein [Sinomonas terrae]MCH6470109.1 dihydrodipicolinate synthase family protein [Sinomonas terrae]
MISQSAPSAPISGAVPVMPTIFDDEGELDLAGQRRVIDHLIEAEVDGICVHANYSEQFSLTDGERQQVLDLVGSHAAGRIPFFVTTSHYSTRVAVERTRAARDAGASAVMLMPPFVGATIRAGEQEMLHYFEAVAAVGVPIMVQDAPMSPTPLPVHFLARLAREIEEVKYVKIEVAGAAGKLRALKAAAGDALPGLFDGEEGITLIPDLAAGAVGTMCSASVPHELGRIVRDYLAGREEQASEAWEALLPLIHFENRQCGPAACKVLLKEGGVIGSDAMRSPWPALHPDTRAALVRLARSRGVFALSGATQGADA